MSNTQLYRSILGARKSGIIGLLNTPEGAGAAAAYSLQMLNADFIGQDIIEVFRVDDSATMRFPLTASGVPMDEIASFCGASDGRVSWIQSQHDIALDFPLTQNAEASSPKIYDGSTGIYLENGKPSIHFSGVQFMLSPIVSGASQPFSLFFVRRDRNTLDNDFIDTLGLEIERIVIDVLGDNRMFAGGAQTSGRYAPANTTLSLHRLFFNTTSRGAINNESLLLFSDVGNNSLQRIRIGGNDQDANYNFSELIYYNSDKLSDDSFIRQNRMGVYGIS